MPRNYVSDRICAEQIRMIYRTGRLGVIAAAVSAFLLAGALQFIGGSTSLGTRLWLAYVVLVVAGHLALCQRFWRAAPADAAWRAWALGFVAFSVAEGTMWAVASAALTVGCRRRDGLRIEVWDTGRGIPLDQQQQIFREFYQLANSERDRAKGLGLGLAIVDRLAKLLDCRLSLQSAPGKGSVFQIAVPLAHNQVFDASLAPETPLNVMPHGLILVIDDDGAIQGAMASLLSSWGHEVLAAGCLAEMLERVETSPRRPDLILCDYRLRDGENGIDVIRRLQSNYNEALPAVVITGDTAPDRLREARESCLVLLHKPVTNIKLRATVGNLIRANIRDR